MDTWQAHLARIDRLMRRKLGAAGHDLRARARAGRRRLPRAQRRRLDALMHADGMQTHPRLALTVDQAALRREGRALRAYLEAYDAAEARKTALLRIGAAIAFNLLAVFALVIVVLVWRGLV